MGIIGGGLAGMITAMDLSEAGHEVEIFEARPFMGGKVSLFFVLFFSLLFLFAWEGVGIL